MYITAAPIVMYGILDKDVQDNVALANPELYVFSSRGLFFTQRIFWAWVASACWESLAICIFASFSLDNGGTSGEDEDIWVIGMLTFTMVIVTANLRVAIEQNIWQWPQLLAYLQSYVSWLVTGFVMESPSFAAQLEQLGGEFLKIFTNSLRLPAFWFAVFLAPWVALFPTVLYKTIKRHLYPELHHILGEQSRNGMSSKSQRN